MAANLPTYDEKRIPVGGARIFIGAIGTTPSADIGSIDVDGGVTVRMIRQGADVRQGFPSLPILRYVSQEDCEVELNGLEINPEMLRYAMGAGITTSSASKETYAFGGDPAVTTCALLVRSEMLPGHTISVNVWKARGMSDTVEMVFGSKPTTFPYKWQALHSSTDWAGTSLNSKAQLVQVVYDKA